MVKTAANSIRAKKNNKPEKRLKRYRSSASKAIQQRIDRAKTQKMFLIRSGDPNPDTLGCDFVVLGSTGNVYTVTIQRLPHCTCPDHAKGNLCKHILFVLLKVMRLDPCSKTVFQAAWIDSELQSMYQQMRERYCQIGGSQKNLVLANKRVRDEFAQLENGETTADEEDADVAHRRKISEDDDCPICFDALGDLSIGNTTYCRGQCGANFHQGKGNYSHLICRNET